MTDDQIPETPTEIAKRLWDTAIAHLEHAANSEDVDASNAYVGIGELALRAAQFALTNPGLLLGISDQIPGLPAGAPPLPAHMLGPKMWGAPQS